MTSEQLVGNEFPVLIAQDVHELSTLYYTFPWVHDLRSHTTHPSYTQTSELQHSIVIPRTHETRDILRSVRRGIQAPPQQLDSLHRHHLCLRAMALGRDAGRMPRQPQCLFCEYERRVPGLSRVALGAAGSGLSGGLVQERAKAVDVPD